MADSDFVIDFTEGEDQPQGELLLEIVKATAKLSKNGNKMLSVQLKVIDGADGKFNSRSLFDNWMLAGNGTGRTGDALRAFLGRVPAKGTSMTAAELVGTQTWATVILEESTAPGYEGTVQSRIRKYGIPVPA